MKAVVRRINLAIRCVCVSGQLTFRKVVLFPYLNANNTPKVTLTSRRLPVSTVYIRTNSLKKKSAITFMCLLVSFLMCLKESEWSLRAARASSENTLHAYLSESLIGGEY